MSTCWVIGAGWEAVMPARMLRTCVRRGLRDKAVKELEGFKRELEGAVDLRVPDRLALDPRVR